MVANLDEQLRSKLDWTLVFGAYLWYKRHCILFKVRQGYRNWQWPRSRHSGFGSTIIMVIHLTLPFIVLSHLTVYVDNTLYNYCIFEVNRPTNSNELFCFPRANAINIYIFNFPSDIYCIPNLVNEIFHFAGYKLTMWKISMNIDKLAQRKIIWHNSVFCTYRCVGIIGTHCCISNNIRGNNDAIKHFIHWLVTFNNDIGLQRDIPT